MHTTFSPRTAAPLLSALVVGLTFAALLSACGAEPGDEQPCLDTCSARACGQPDGCGGICMESGGACLAPDTPGSLVPLYGQPTHPAWERLIALKRSYPAVPVIAVVNPDSGSGTKWEKAMNRGIRRLNDAGIVVLGYVATTYGERPAQEVETEIERYATFYPEVEGIFFDQQSNRPGGEGYYASLSSFAEGWGFSLSVGNPGTDTRASYLDTVDILVLHGDAGVPESSHFGAWTEAHPPSRFSVVAYGVRELDGERVSQLLPHAGYVYVNDDELPNPWDTLPPYLEELFERLATRTHESG